MAAPRKYGEDCVLSGLRPRSDLPGLRGLHDVVLPLLALRPRGQAARPSGSALAAPLADKLDELLGVVPLLVV